MTELPGWFGVQEFYFIIATVWFYLICWVVVNITRVKGTKLDIKKKILSFKQWNAKRKERKELKLLEG